MRIHILNDLHLEFADFKPAKVEADVTILAGDTCTGCKGIRWALENFPDRPVIYVAGNHEFYGQSIPSLFDKMRAMSAGTNVHVLENEIFRLRDVTFFGATLWTDFALYGDVLGSATSARLGMADFLKIRLSPSYMRFSPKDARYFHQQTRDWLNNSLPAENIRTVVVTHHAPSPRSLRSVAKPDGLDSAYASNLEDSVERWKPSLWIHGHIHEPKDYKLFGTRIVNNSRGYPDENIANFVSNLVVEI